jgi:hypothetical protein
MPRDAPTTWVSVAEMPLIWPDKTPRLAVRAPWTWMHSKTMARGECGRRTGDQIAPISSSATASSLQPPCSDLGLDDGAPYPADRTTVRPGGQDDCSASVCSPLWTATVGSSVYPSSVIIANGTLYVSSQDTSGDGEIVAYGLS